jgi:DNA-binding NarL/FixJ family response regulator
MIRLLLVDDQQLIRDGLKAMLEIEPDLEVIGTADNGKVALSQIATLQPDIVLMDVRMPVMDGREATRLISDRFPDTKVLVLSTFDDDHYIADAVRAGAQGYLLKDMPAEELAQAIRLLHCGYTQFATGVFEKLMHNVIGSAIDTKETNGAASTAISTAVDDRLTPREKEVLQLIADGSTNRNIAQQLYISEGTVKSHVTHLLTRLNLRNRAQLAIYAHSTFSKADKITSK